MKVDIQALGEQCRGNPDEVVQVTRGFLRGVEAELRRSRAAEAILKNDGAVADFTRNLAA